MWELMIRALQRKMVAVLSVHKQWNVHVSVCRCVCRGVYVCERQREHILHQTLTRQEQMFCIKFEVNKTMNKADWTT